MTNRRNFIKQAAAAGIAAGIPSALYPQQKPENKMIWANLIHLSYNMWEDNVSFEGFIDKVPVNYRDVDFVPSNCMEARGWAHVYRPDLTFDEAVWDTLLKEMADVGMNMVVIDLGDAILYDTHPEIAVKNAWSPEKLRSELSRMRKMGLEPIPKLNFATTHDTWLGKYSRMVSSGIYYAVCRDLIKEVIELFDNPRFFHLGMDEETAAGQRRQDFAVIRQNDLWWGDLYFFVGEVEKRGVRSWIWSDYGWSNPDLFLRKMPKSVLQSNWYYGADFGQAGKISPYVKMYDSLETNGFDQIPTGSNTQSYAVKEGDLNIEATVDYCTKAIDPSRLSGFMVAAWRPTLAPCLETHKAAIRQLGKAMKKVKI